ncbi:hypothetical protein [Lentzea flava]|uniref:Transmembrane protein n=1 Tax=Lentzea flava TaxID=103732 RepID=A0ABQ2V0Z1_9PSEU|nr:hypothetical protein [Lentzea flava]MCP2202769.1 hypothetical protein [Lentzea flava]GGU63700.1 hypothetical protein GCM10010178_64710 [Lentzea flava]
MELDILFGGNSSNSSDLDAIDTDAEVHEVEEAREEDENGIGWKVLALFICGGLVITALAVAFMVWVIEGLVL